MQKIIISLLAATAWSQVYGLDKVLCHSHTINPDETKTTLLHKAIEKNLHPECEELVEAGSDLNAQDGLGRTPLSLAISCGNIEACKIILKAGVPLNSKDRHESISAQAFLSSNNDIRELFCLEYIKENRDKIDPQLLETDFAKTIATGDSKKMDELLPPITVPSDNVKKHHVRISADDPGVTFFIMPKADFEPIREHNAKLICNKRSEFGDTLFSAALFAAVSARQFNSIKRLVDYKVL